MVYNSALLFPVPSIHTAVVCGPYVTSLLALPVPLSFLLPPLLRSLLPTSHLFLVPKKPVYSPCSFFHLIPISFRSATNHMSASCPNMPSEFQFISERGSQARDLWSRSARVREEIIDKALNLCLLMRKLVAEELLKGIHYTSIFLSHNICESDINQHILKKSGWASTEYLFQYWRFSRLNFLHWSSESFSKILVLLYKNIHFIGILSLKP